MNNKLYLWIDKIAIFAMMVFALVPMTSAALTDNAIRLVVLVAVLGIYLKHFEINRVNNRITYFALLYFFVLLLSAVFNYDIVRGLKLTWQRIFEILPLFILMITIKSKERILLLLNTFLSAMIIADSYYIWQFITRSVLAGGAIGNRPSGFYWEDWFMPIFLTVVIPTCIVMLDFLWTEISLRYRFFISATLILSATAALCSYFRGLWISLVLFLLIYGIFRLYKKKKVLLSLLIMFLLLFISSYNLSDGFKQRINTLGDMQFTSNSHRLLVWKSALDMFRDNLYLGVGQGNWYENYVSKYRYSEEDEILPNAHNSYLQVLSETGGMGLVAYVLLMLQVFILAKKRYREGCNSYTKAGAMVMFFSTLVFMIDGLTGDYIHNRTLVEVLWFFVGIGYVLSDNKMYTDIERL